MTIHKSKGLEFDTVIVPGLGRTTRSDTPPPIIYSRRSADDGDAQLVLAPIHARGDDAGTTYDFIRQLEADKQRYEDGRLLYVAATRARRHLHLLGAAALDADGVVKPPPPSSLLARLWPAVEADFALAAATQESPTEVTVSPATQVRDVIGAPSLRRFISGWTAPLLPQGLSADAPVATPASPRLDRKSPRLNSSH